MTVRRLAAYETSVTIWQDAVLHQPDDPMAHYNLGVALVEEGRPPQEAMMQFEHALRLDPEHTGALDNLGMLLNRLGRPREAMTRFEEALRIEPDDAVAHNNLGAVLIALGRPQEAIQRKEGDVDGTDAVDQEGCVDARTLRSARRGLRRMEPSVRDREGGGTTCLARFAC